MFTFDVPTVCHSIDKSVTDSLVHILAFTQGIWLFTENYIKYRIIVLMDWIISGKFR